MEEPLSGSATLEAGLLRPGSGPQPSSDEPGWLEPLGVTSA